MELSGMIEKFCNYYWGINSEQSRSLNEKFLEENGMPLPEQYLSFLQLYNGFTAGNGNEIVVCSSDICDEDNEGHTGVCELNDEIQYEKGNNPDDDISDLIFLGFADGTLVDIGITPHTPIQNRTCPIKAYGFSFYIFIHYL